MSEEKTYRMVESFFSEFRKNVIDSEKVKKLDKEDDWSELAKWNVTLNDGQVIEICFWHESDIYLYDLSVDKEKFDAAYDTSFESYMSDMGIYTENIEEANGSKWRYYGDQHAEKKGIHLLQYYMEEGRTVSYRLRWN